MLIIVGHLVVGLKILAPKLIDLEAALVHVEMNIAFLKIGRAGLPNLGLGMTCELITPESRERVNRMRIIFIMENLFEIFVLI